MYHASEASLLTSFRVGGWLRKVTTPQVITAMHQPQSAPTCGRLQASPCHTSLLMSLQGCIKCPHHCRLSIGLLLLLHYDGLCLQAPP